MRILSLLFLFGLAGSGNARADQKILDCNFNFGDIAQIQIFRGSTGYSYNLLTNTGRWLPSVRLDSEAWRNRMIRFEYRGERYEFYSTDGREIGRAHV